MLLAVMHINTQMLPGVRRIIHLHIKNVFLLLLHINRGYLPQKRLIRGQLQAIMLP